MAWKKETLIVEIEMTLESDCPEGREEGLKDIAPHQDVCSSAGYSLKTTDRKPVSVRTKREFVLKGKKK